jgi:hypothetical protein
MPKTFLKTLESIAILTAGLALPAGLAVYNHYHKIQEPTWAVDAGVAFYYAGLGIKWHYRKKL